ncbi:MAG: type I pullulanase [Ruminococcus sp.]|nr:type I pullulanase [Ruminococcus sp.]
MTKKIIASLLCVMLIVSSVVIASAADTSKSAAGDNSYTTACESIDAEYAYSGNDLGATYTPEATTFKVWAPKALSVTLNRYKTGSDSEEGAGKIGTVNMTKLKDGDNWTGVWTCTVEGDIVNTYYTYTVNTFDVLNKKRQTTETEDVYSWATGVNGKRSMVVDLSSTNPEGWENDSHVLCDSVTESYVWEVHVKDFSYAENSGVSEKNRGKYLAFTETGTTLNKEGEVSTCIDYLKKLGVTTVQINPFYDFGSIQEGGSDTQFNWGYDPMNYNVPEGSYSSNPYDGNVRIKECKQMIQALHNAGISVIMDVVYNHTYVTDTCFNRTVPNYYYRMKDDKGTYSQASGCGNDTASERAMFRKYMIDSCRYWVDEYHVDGFRYDLMGLHDAETMNLIRENLDQVDSRIAMWGEGWSMGSSFPTKTCTGAALRPATQANSSQLNERIGFFSDEIRDVLKGSVFQKTAKGWLQGAGGGVKKLLDSVRAKPGNIGGAVPSKVVQYASCHDNQTLWDRLADSQGVKDFRARTDLLVKETKLNAVFLHTSQGITFTLAGEELGRSKDNDENSYSSPADENMIDWSLAETNADIASYYSGLRKIRENFSPLTANDRTTGTCKTDILNPVYKKVDVADVLQTSDGYSALWTNTVSSEWKNLLVIANNSSKATTYTLNNTNTDWVIIADDQQAGVKKLGEVNDNIFKVEAHSAVIAVDKASFDSIAVQNTRGAVTVSALDTVTGKTIESYTVTGEIGNKYSVSVPKSVGMEYELKNITGETKGVFAEEDKNILMEFGYYVPASVKNVDLTGDGKTNINDATALQLHIAGKKLFSDEYEAKADVSRDGTINVNDVLMVQRYVAQLSVGIGTVSVNYINLGDDQKAAPSSVIKGRVGENFTCEPAQLLGFELDTTQLPPTNTVTFIYGNVDVNYYYNKVASEINLHVKHSSGTGFDPSFWIWGQNNGVDTDNYCKNTSWPGDTITESDENGWYSTSFTVDPTDTAYNFIVSSNGSPQSADCKGFINSELWIVIDDSKDGVNLIVYDVNPDNNPGAVPIYTT